MSREDKPVSPRYNARLIEQMEQRIRDLQEENARLRNRENEYQMIFAHANDVIMIMDPEFRIKSISPSVRRLIGYSPERLLGRRFMDLGLLPPQYLDQAIADASRVQEGERLECAIYEVIAKDGSRRWGEFSSSPIFRDGVITGQINLCRDITEKKQAEENLRESEKIFRNIAETSRDVIFRVTTDGTFSYVSPSGEQVFGYSPQEFIGTHILSYPASFDYQASAQAFARAVNGSRVDLFEFQAVRKDGALVPVEVSAAPITRDGEIIGVQGIARDISERKEAERRQQELEDQVRQAQKMEAIGTLAGGIAHDFNNILASIIGYTELASEEISEGTQLHQNLQEVLKGSYRARDLVRQILTFSRKAEEEKKPVQVKLMVKESLKLLRSTLPANIRIEKSIASDSLVMCHPTQIHQIIMNLSTNAAHAMDPEGGTLRIEMADTYLDNAEAEGFHGMSPGGYLDLSISDTGAGMAQNIIPQIFDPYFTTKQKGSGTGLGLSVVHGIVSSLNGQISVNSEPGLGTRFRILLPRLTSASQPPQQNIQSPVTGGSERLLIVDDEPALADLLRQMLVQLGYGVTARTSSTEALELFRENSGAFDLVITDMMMPGMTGTVLAQQIRAIRSDIPIILCTGYSEQIDARTATSYGVSAYTLKPVVKQQLAGLVRRLLDNSM